MSESWLARLAAQGKRLFGQGAGDDVTTAAHELYARAVAQARLPIFYGTFAVPDTHDGRLELIQLHVILLLRRLQRGDETARTIGQALFDVLFADVDRSLREGGVGDLAVGKWVKKIARQFYARAAAVEGALETRDTAALGDILAVNVYGSAPEHERSAAALAAYLLAADGRLADAVAATCEPIRGLHFEPPSAKERDFVAAAATPAAP